MSIFKPAEPSRPDLPSRRPTPQSYGAVDRSAPTQTEGSKLIVGRNIKLKGVEITDCDTLVVEGRVEASMDSRVIQIAESGAFVGTAGIDTAEIHGRFEGELTARTRLVIHATGRVSGKIRYGSIAIEDGGQISGDVAALAEAEAPASLTRRKLQEADAGKPAGEPATAGMKSGAA